MKRDGPHWGSLKETHTQNDKKGEKGHEKQPANEDQSRYWNLFRCGCFGVQGSCSSLRVG
ncbi:hypothetical protein EBQ74_09900 [bacterium]|nr:hypothetical protein [bacterium]